MDAGYVSQVGNARSSSDAERLTSCMGFSASTTSVLAAYLAGITVFGSRFRRPHRSVKDYFLGSRQTSWVVISLSIVATETSTLTLDRRAGARLCDLRRARAGRQPHLSPGRARLHRGAFRDRAGSSSRPIFNGEMLTAYELLNRRFGPRAKHFAASLFLVMRALAEGVRVFAASLVLAAVLGASVPGLPHLWLWSIVLVGRLTLVYTFEGGIAAVIWTDLDSVVIYVGGSILAAWMLVRLVPGGWSCDCRRRARGRQAAGLLLVARPDGAVHVLGRPDRRLLSDDGVARNRPAPGAAPADMPKPA